MAETEHSDQTEYRHVYGGKDPSGGFEPLRFPLPRFARHSELGGSPPNWFIGPRGENIDLFTRLIGKAIESNQQFRTSFRKDDDPVITDAVKQTPEFVQGLEVLEATFDELLRNLRNDSTPYYSWRYQGHMLWDTTLPAMAGYFATMLHNPNNVTIQASTLTTFLEEMVGWDLCGMFGFPFPDLSGDSTKHEVTPHGHLTSGGTVANVEATWAARELKFLPVIVHGALTESDSPLYWYSDDEKRQITVQTAEGPIVPVVELDQWQLLNIRQDSALQLTERISDLGPPTIPGDRMQLRWRRRDVWDLLLGKSANTLGLAGFYAEFLSKEHLTPIGPPVILGPVTWHYSWPKAMALVGAGTAEPNILTVQVDAIGRMDLDDLRFQLNRAKAARNPVLLTVAVLGSTEESAVDDLEAILEIREQFRADGLEFNVHVDAAWGGYFASILRRDYEDPGDHNRHEGGTPFLADLRPPIGEPAGDGGDDADHHDGAEYDIFMSDHVRRQIEAIRRADSATIDPHKTGYVPYPAGSIIYRNGELRRLITFGAPVIGSSTTALSVGEYGVEGSKPGAAAAAVYLSHAVIRPSHCGHGKLMNASLINTRAFYTKLLQRNLVESDFVVVPLVDVRLPADPVTGEQRWMATDGDAMRPEYAGWLAGTGPAPAAVAELGTAVDGLLANAHAPIHQHLSDNEFAWLRSIGPDLNIVDYMFNFRNEDGRINTDLRLLNLFNREIYDGLHVPAGEILGRALRREVSLDQLKVLVSKTEIWRNTYGDDFVFPFLQRLGITTFGPGRQSVTQALLERNPDERDAREQRIDCYRKLIVMRSVIMDPFLDVPINVESGSFADEWMDALSDVVRPIALRYRKSEFNTDADCGD